METKQAVWKFLANLGDASPLDHGGYFVYEDETKVYCAQGVILETNDETWERVNRCRNCEGINSPCYIHAKLEYVLEYRFDLDKCTLTEGILSDNPYHPLHPVWFSDDLDSIANSLDMTKDDLQALFCSDDPLERAQAYREVGQSHGFENFDSYPLTWTVGQYAELKARFKDECK